MNVATRIQHVPSRAHLIPPLLARLDGLHDVQVVTDPGGPKPSSWRTHRLCLEATPDDATHLLCLQDDALPCDDFAARALAAIEERPDRIIAFFLPGIGYLTRQVLVARKRKQRWLDLAPMSFVPLVAVVYPVAVARAIPGFADRRRMNVGRADDAVVGTYVRGHRIQACATLPCLVEHDDEIESAMGMRSGTGKPYRSAAWFVQSPLAKTAT